MKKYIVYQTTNKINNKIYIGVHGIENEKFDGYLGCGVVAHWPKTYKNPKFPFQYAVKKYGPKSFIRTIIHIFDNKEDAYALEKLLVNEEFIQRNDTYNITLGGWGPTAPDCRIKIYMYDLDGNFEKEFFSLKEATSFLNAKNTGHLPRAIKQGHQFLGHQFSYKKVPFMKKLKHRKITTVDMPYIGKRVGRFDDNDNLLEVYNTMTDCVKSGYKNAKMVAQGRREHCKGYKFKYLD